MAEVSAARIGARIRKIRVSKGLSQREVAEPEMTPPYLSLIETGQRTPSLQVLTYLAEKLGVDVSELQTGVPSNLRHELELDLQNARGLSHNGALDEADNALGSVLKTARRHDLARVTARALCVKASVREKQGQIEEANELYDQAQGLLADEPTHTRFEAVVGFARTTSTLGETRLAVHLLEAYLIDLEQQGMGDPTATMRVHSASVQLYRRLGMEREAVDAAEKALRLAPQVQDPEQVACMNMNVARVLLDQERHDDAMAALRQAEQVYQSLDWPLPAVQAQINRGIVALDKERLDLARDIFLEAVAILENHPDERAEMGAVLNYLGKVERLRGDLASAAGHLERAKKLLPKDEVFERAMNAHELGLSLSESDPERAKKALREAAQILERAGAGAEAARVMLDLGRLVMEQGDPQEAARIFEEGLSLSTTSSL